METIKEEARQLLRETQQNELTQYRREWQEQVVNLWNEFVENQERYGEEIYSTADDIWDDITKQQVEQRGWVGIKHFLAQLDNTAEWATIDVYGNARTADNELLDNLEEILETEE